jgi:hypothetical protein
MRDLALAMGIKVDKSNVLRDRPTEIISVANYDLTKGQIEIGRLQRDLEEGEIEGTAQEVVEETYRLTDPLIKALKALDRCDGV